MASEITWIICRSLPLLPRVCARRLSKMTLKNNLLESDAMLVQLLIRAYHSGSPLSASRTTVMPKQSLSQGTERKASQLSQHSLGLLDQDFWAILALCTKTCGCFPLFSLALSLIRLQLIRSLQIDLTHHDGTKFATTCTDWAPCKASAMSKLSLLVKVELSEQDGGIKIYNDCGMLSF